MMLFSRACVRACVLITLECHLATNILLFLCSFRWKHTEPQDIVVSCARMSLDMIEGTWEDLRCPIMPRKFPPVSSAMQLPSKEQFAGNLLPSYLLSCVSLPCS